MYILQKHSYVEYEIDDTVAIAVSSNQEALMTSIPGNWDNNKLVVSSISFDGRNVPVNHAYEAEWFTISEIKEL